MQSAIKLVSITLILLFSVEASLARDKPVIVFMDTFLFGYNPKNIGGDSTRTNIDNLTMALSDFSDSAHLIAEYTHPYWQRHKVIRNLNPELIVIHLSAFDNVINDTLGLAKIIEFIRFMRDSKTRFIIYSRTPNIETSKVRKEKFYRAINCAGNNCSNIFRFVRISNPQSFPNISEVNITLRRHVKELIDKPMR